MGRRAVATGLLMGMVALLLVACGGGGDDTSDDATEPTKVEANEREARATVRSFLKQAQTPEVEPLCALLSDDYRNRLAPGGGGCVQALTTLTSLLQPNAVAFTEKVVERSVMEGNTAVVVVADQVTEENEVPIRLTFKKGQWGIDEIGPGAELTMACIDEKQLVVDAVDEYLSDRSEYPADAKAMVPSHLERLPNSHEVRPDGSVVATGLCA